MTTHDIPEINSRWYAWGHHHTIIAHGSRDGEPAIVARRDPDQDHPSHTSVIISDIFMSHAIPSGHGGDPSSTPGHAAPGAEDRPQPGTDEPNKGDIMAANEPKAPTKGSALFDDLRDAVKNAKLGKWTLSPNGSYARVLDGKRNLTYAKKMKESVDVWVLALASSMPAGLAFEKVEIGSHNNGKSEVLVRVVDSATLEAAVEALGAAKATGAIPRTSKAQES